VSNTPGVVRWLSEAIVHHNTDARLIRINPAHAQVPRSLAGRAISIAEGAAEALEARRDAG